MPNFYKFQVLFKIPSPLFHRHIFTLSKINKYKTIFNNNLANFFNFVRIINQTANKRLISINRKKLTATSLAACGLFNWDEHRITNDEIKKEVNEMMNVFESTTKNDDFRLKIDFEATRNFQDKEWTKIYDKPDLLIWRRKIGYDSENGLDIFEHKVLGRFDEITPIEYYQVQVDLEYRKEWDFLIKFLEMIKKDPASSTELVRWVSKFPYPLCDREYIFVRRYCIEPKEKLLVLLSRGLDQVPEDLPYDKRNVLVTQYKSNMIIIPYTDIDKPGIYYVIQYYDVNKAKIPKLAYKWMATSGLPDYVGKLHQATINMRERKENEDEKNLLDSFDLFYMNEPEKDAVDVEVPACSQEAELDEKMIEEEQIVVSHVKELREAREEKDLDDVVPPFVRKVIDKLNEDYFEEYEPHPVFHHY